MQIRVPEDLKLLGVLERTFTAIKVREANLSACLIYKFNSWIEKLMIVVIVQFVYGKVSCRSEMLNWMLYVWDSCVKIDNLCQGRLFIVYMAWFSPNLVIWGMHGNSDTVNTVDFSA